MKPAKAENLVSNYYVLQRVAGWLNRALQDMYNMYAFEEPGGALTIGFRAKGKETFLKLNLQDEAFVFFPEKVKLPRQPRMRFEQLENARFEHAAVHLQDRSFRIRFGNDYTLVFLLYGRNGNVLLFNGDSCIEALRKNITTYTDKPLSFFDTHLLPDKKQFLDVTRESVTEAVNTFFPAFPVEFRARITPGMEPEEAWSTSLNIDDELARAGLQIATNVETRPALSLQIDGQSGQDIDETLNGYARQFYRQKKEQQEKQRELSKLISEKKRLEKNVSSLEIHLKKLGETKNYKRQADLLMANLYAIPAGAEKIVVQDFETGEPVELKLKKELSPQAWAEKLYHKAKGQQKEKEITQAQLAQAEQRLAEVRSQITDLEVNGIGTVVNEKGPKSKKQPEKELPFRSITYQGYSIYIGKSAANNDELTFKFAHKEDTWLHARGVSGSHVIIRHKAKGKEIPKPVLEAAASLAAFNSKAKHSSLVPVAYTLRKFVRKPKGAAPGAVIIEKEKVILVEPAAPKG